MNRASESQNLPKVQLAAGGIVWQTIGGIPKMAVIHRPKYDDWTLPKGKPEPTETLAETARREVMEELGCDVRFLDFVGTTHYLLPDGRMKLVLFWNMAPRREINFYPNAEVDDVSWLTRREAATKLSHPTERELVVKCTTPARLLTRRAHVRKRTH